MANFAQKTRIKFGIITLVSALVIFILAVTAITINSNNDWRYYMSVASQLPKPIPFENGGQLFTKTLQVSFGTGLGSMILAFIMIFYALIYSFNAFGKAHLSPKSMRWAAYIIGSCLGLAALLSFVALGYATQIPAVFTTTTQTHLGWQTPPDISAVINHTSGPSTRPGDIAILFYIGKFAVRAYSIAILAGIITAILTIIFFWTRQGYPIEVLQILILIVVPLGIIGARLWFVLERLIYEPAHSFPNWYKFWDGGLAIQGGVILATIGGFLYAYPKRHLIDLKIAVGIIMPAAIIGQAIGRWGNFANHEVFGKIDDPNGITSSWLGLFIKSNMYIDGHYRVPLFFYEFLTSLIGYVVIVWMILFFNWTKPGTTAGIYLMWYGIVRVAMEPLRAEKYAFYSVLAIMFIVSGLLWTLWCQFKIKVKLLSLPRATRSNKHSNQHDRKRAQLKRGNTKRSLKIFFDHKPVYQKELKWGGAIWVKVTPQKMSKRSLNAASSKK